MLFGLRSARKRCRNIGAEHLLIFHNHCLCRVFFAPTALGAGHHHIGLAAPAAGTNEPLAPLGNRPFGAVSFGHFGWRSHLRWLRQELRSGIGTGATFGGTK
jgi:hypothetical protein